MTPPSSWPPPRTHADPGSRLVVEMLAPHRTDRVVADECASVHAHIDAPYGQVPTGALPADVDTAATKPTPDIRQRAVHPPAELDCRMETVYETCASFAS